MNAAPSRRKQWLLVTTLLVAAACSSALRGTAIQLAAAPDANDNRPITVDLVVVLDTSLVTVLSTLSASEWFARREQIRLQHPDGLRSSQLEILPGTTVDRTLMHQSSEAIFLFADYHAPGLNRLRLDAINQPLVRFGIRGMEAVARGRTR